MPELEQERVGRDDDLAYCVVVVHNLISVGKLDWRGVLCFKCYHFKLARRVYSADRPPDALLHGLTASWQSK